MHRRILTLLILSLLVILYGLQGMAIAAQPNLANIEGPPAFLHFAAEQSLSAEELKTIASEITERSGQ